MKRSLFIIILAATSTTLLESCTSIGVVAVKELSSKVMNLEKTSTQIDSLKVKMNQLTEFPANVGAFNYTGQKISLQNKFGAELFMHESSEEKNSAQGAAVSGELLFQFYNTNPRISIYNLQTKQLVQEIPLTARKTFHCNNANFGNEYYDKQDTYPLLYVSMENEAEHKCLVYRITGEEGSMKADVVQTIIYPEPKVLSLYYPNAIIDAQNGCMWLTGYSTANWHAAVGNKTKYVKFRLPSLKEGDITLKPEEVLTTCVLPSMTATQGAICLNGKIYQMFDVGPTTYLRVFNGNAIETEVKLHEAGLSVEPENIFFYKGNLYYTSVQRDIRKLYF